MGIAVIIFLLIIIVGCLIGKNEMISWIIGIGVTLFLISMLGSCMG